MEQKPKRRWFQYHLSTAMIAMLLAAVGLGIYIHFHRDEGKDGDEWQRNTRKILERKVRLKFENVDLRSAVNLVLRKTIFHDNVIFDSKLTDIVNISLNVEDVSASEAITRICAAAKVNWDVCHGVLIFLPTGAVPPPTSRPTTDDGWKLETLTKLSKNVTFCYFDTTLSDQVEFLSSLSHIRIDVDPRCKDSGMGTAMNVNDMRMDDALTWLCFFGDAEWKLQKAANGEDEIAITPRTQKEQSAPP